MNRLTIPKFLEMCRAFSGKQLRIYREKNAIYLQEKKEGGFKTVADISSDNSIYDAMESEQLYKRWLKSFFL